MNIEGAHFPRTTPATATTTFRISPMEKKIPAYRWIHRTLSIPPIFRMSHWEKSRCQNRWDRPVANRISVERTIPQCSQTRSRLNLRIIPLPSARVPFIALPPPSAVDRVTPHVQKDLQDQADDHDGEENPVGGVDDEDQRVLRRGRLVVEQPGVREVLVRVRVALLAPFHEDGLDDGRAGTPGAGDAVRSMAVRAHGDRPRRLVQLFPLFLVEAQRDAMEIGEVGLQNVG